MSEVPPKRRPKRSWPFLEAEMRNRFYSVSPSVPTAPGDVDEERLPYSTRDLPQWQVEIIDHYPLLYRCPEMGRDDYCHLRHGFACEQTCVPAICALSDIIIAHLKAERLSAQPDANIEIVEIWMDAGKLRLRFADNLSTASRLSLIAALDGS